MKKFLPILLALVLVLSGCSKETTTTTTPLAEQTTAKATTEVATEESKETTEKTTEESTEEESEESTEEKSTEEESTKEESKENAQIDEELLKSVFEDLQNQDEINYYAKSIMNMSYGGESMEMEIIQCHYNGFDMTNTDGSISIYDEKEDAYYSYIEGTNEGTKMIDIEEDVSVSSTPTFSEESYEDLLDGLVAARIEKLNGEDVLYLEYLDTEEGMEVTMKMWYSIKNNFPMKISVVDETGNAFMESEVTEFRTDEDFSEFVKIPKDVTFTEIEGF